MVKNRPKPPGKEIRPVFAPEIPQKHLHLLQENSGHLLPSDATLRSASRALRLTLVAAGALFALTGILLLSWAAPFLIWVTPVAVGLFVIFTGDGDPGSGCAGLIVGLVIAGMIAAAGVDEIRWLLITAAAIMGGIYTFSLWIDQRNQDLCVEYHDRYLIPDDFDAIATGHLERVQRAFDTVRQAAAPLGGWFDAQQATVMLAEQEWQVAQSLAKQTLLRRQQEEMGRHAAGHRVIAALQPQVQALAVVVEATCKRIAAIENYAHHVKGAQIAHYEWWQCQAIAARNHEYEDLLAATVKDELAAGDVRTLDAQTAPLKAAFDAQIDQAVRIGRHLADAAKFIGPGT